MKFEKANSAFIKKSRELRQNSTLSEVLLWNKLKQKQLCALDFDRQKVINNRYILDFYCPALQLAIEIDGFTHDDKYEYDAARDNYLKSLGIKVLHFDDRDVKFRISDVLYSIEEIVKHELTTTCV
jgi:very-short-patch-repair endonuclease